MCASRVECNIVPVGSLVDGVGGSKCKLPSTFLGGAIFLGGRRGFNRKRRTNKASPALFSSLGQIKFSQIFPRSGGVQGPSGPSGSGRSGWERVGGRAPKGGCLKGGASKVAAPNGRGPKISVIPPTWASSGGV